MGITRSRRTRELNVAHILAESPRRNFARVFGKNVGRGFALDGYYLGICEAIHHLVQASIEENGSMVNNDHTRSQSAWISAM